MAKIRRFPPLYPPTWAPRFWRLVDRPMLTPRTPDPIPCWEWKGALDTDGYGVFELRGSKPAHRLAYELKVGPVPRGQVLLHSCDNPPCCNYHHLTPGTQQDNMQDMVAKGRHGNRYVSPVSGAPEELEVNQICPYCGELTPDLKSHYKVCDFAEGEESEEREGNNGGT